MVREIRSLLDIGFNLEDTRPFVECLRSGRGSGAECPGSIEVLERKLAARSTGRSWNGCADATFATRCSALSCRCWWTSGGSGARRATGWPWSSTSWPPSTRDGSASSKLDVDANPDTTRARGVLSMPTLIVFHNGQVQSKTIGARPKFGVRAARRGA